MAHFFFIVHALSFKLNFFRPEFLFKIAYQVLSQFCLRFFLFCTVSNTAVIGNTICEMWCEDKV